MNRTQSPTRAPLGGLLTILGGALLSVGYFLTWAEVTAGGTTVTASGADDSRGYITLAAGVITVAVGFAITRGVTRDLARALTAFAIFAAITGGGFGLYTALTTKESVLDAAAEAIAPDLGASAEQVRAALDQRIDAGQLSVSISIGLYVVIAGGVIALAGGIVGLRLSTTKPATTSAGTLSSAPPSPVPRDVGTVPPSPAAEPPSDEGGD